MKIEKEISTKLIGFISLFVIGYILFISVFNQIIAQGEGVFYFLILVGILILAFVLLSLITKLLDITKEISDGMMWNLVEFIMFITAAYIFVTYRLTFESSVSAEETVLYRTAYLLSQGELADKGLDLISNLILYPSKYVYAFILSIFFRFKEASTETVIAVNAAVLIINAFLLDRVIRKVASRTCGLVAAISSLFIPSQAFAVYTYSGEFFLCTILLFSIYIFVIVINGIIYNEKKPVILNVVLGISFALLLFTEPLMLFCLIIYLVYYISIIRDVNKDDEFKKRIIVTVASFFMALLLFNISKSLLTGSDFGDTIFKPLSRFSVTKNIETDETITLGDVFKAFHQNLDNHNSNVNDNLLFLSGEYGETYNNTQNAWFSLSTEMSYMFILIMAIACVFYYIMRGGDKKISLLLVTLVGSFFCIFYMSSSETCVYFLFEILIGIGCCGFHLMYENHHLVDSVEDVTITNNEVFASLEKDEDDLASEEAVAIKRARALIFVGDDDNLYNDIKQEENEVSAPDVIPDGYTQISGNLVKIEEEKPEIRETITYEQGPDGKVVKRIVRKVIKKKAQNPLDAIVANKDAEAVDEPANEESVTNAHDADKLVADAAVVNTKADNVLAATDEPRIEEVVSYINEDGKVKKVIKKKLIKKVKKSVEMAATDNDIDNNESNSMADSSDDRSVKLLEKTDGDGFSFFNN